ncbi:MAG: hypothetical protein IKM99_07555 [Bacteroidales bacterium]|nr:hypothetical protein [Bacteroidales bacterium]
MKQAILITAYKDIRHLERLVDYFDEDFEIFIHIDKKCHEDYHVLEKRCGVRIYDQYKIAWGDLNHLKAILLLMQEAYKQKDLEYFHLITGSDYPVKPLSEFKDFCENHRHDNYVEHFPLPHPDWGVEGGMDRIKYYWIRPSYRVKYGWFIYKTIKLQRKLGINRGFGFFDGKLYGGGTYWSVSRKAVGCALDYLENNPAYLHRFRMTSIAEEICLPTIWANLGISMHNDYKRFIDWGTDGGNPVVLTEKDYERIKNSEALFARKMQSGTSDRLIEMLNNQ